MPLLVANDIEKTWGDRRVLRGCDLVVERGDRVGLVGHNGCGKSTLLSVLAGEVEADHGQVSRSGVIAVLGQEPEIPGTTVGDSIDDALAWHAALVRAWEAAVAAGQPAAHLQDRLDAEGWDLGHKARAVTDRLGCPPRDALVSTLSGGERRRVALARALLASPDLLLLDEPTNHLDAETVTWLESFLAGFRGAVVLVTHDRYLLEAVATRIVEVEDGVCVAYDDCAYSDYLIARAEREARRNKEDARRLALVAQEAAWASRSPAARSTKQKARLQRLEALKAQGGIRRERTLSLELKSGLRLGSTVVELHGVTKGYGGRRLLDRFSVSLAPGERLGVLGPNGIGKSTLLRLVGGEIAPDTGQVVRGARVRVGVVDQDRSGLDPAATVWETAGQGNDHVRVGDTDVHVATFLERFLFAREQFGQHVAGLSGGERARLLLAMLLLRGANVLLLDEPTNDLDLLTLRVLEEALVDFDGCALVVSHDRAFLDRVCTGVLAFEGDGAVTRYADRSQYVRAVESRRQAAAAAPSAPPVDGTPRPAQKRRRSYKEQQELEALPARIEALEAEQAALEDALANPETWRARAAEVPALNARLAELTREIAASYARWEALEAG